jgi:hypothetical protein
MNTPEPKPSPKPSPAPVAVVVKPKLVVPRFGVRDLVLALAILVAIVGFIVLAVQYSMKKPKNTLTGLVRGKYSTGDRETLIEVAPRKGVSSKTVDTGYYLKVFVPEENRTYDVIVEKELWEQKKDGDSLDFLRPPNEQKY